MALLQIGEVEFDGTSNFVSWMAVLKMMMMRITPVRAPVSTPVKAPVSRILIVAAEIAN